MDGSLTELSTWILSSAATRSHQVVKARLAEAGFTGYEYRCLGALRGRDPLSQTALGGAASLDLRDVTHTVRALEDRGLLTRVRDPGHGRRMLVSLTDAGRRAASELGQVMEAIQSEVFGKLSAQERSTLIGLLSRVG